MAPRYLNLEEYGGKKQGHRDKTMEMINVTPMLIFVVFLVNNLGIDETWIYFFFALILAPFLENKRLFRSKRGGKN